MNRTRIGRNSDFATRQIVYRTPVGIEVDELDHFEVVRKRVFYDDVLLVTYHREQSGFGIFLLVVMLLFGIVAAASSSVPPLAMTFAAIAALALIGGVIRLALKVDVVTIFGRRSKAVVRYPFRKAFARRMYEEICASAAAAQGKLANEIAANEPPPVDVAVAVPAEELPPMPNA